MDQRESTCNEVIVLGEVVEEVLAFQHKNMIDFYRFVVSFCLPVKRSPRTHPCPFYFTVMLLCMLLLLIISAVQRLKYLTMINRIYVLVNSD